MSKILVVINEQHSLFEEQEQILHDMALSLGYDSVERVNVPSAGLNVKELESMSNDLVAKVRRGDMFVLASPIPVLLKWLLGDLDFDRVLVFHNDKREKKELPNGKVIMAVSKTGWQLL